MKVPEFWSIDPGPWMPLVRFLEPLGVLYGKGTALRLRFGRPWEAPVPVICVGNVVAGGAGKTPVVLDLLRRLPGAHALLRGYGGSERGPLCVNPACHNVERVGDEALLLSEQAPTWVSRRRDLGAKAASAAGASVLVMDDGLQNPSVKKSLSLLVVDGTFGFGNERLIPAGPLREPLEAVLSRVDAVVVMGEDRAYVRRRIQARTSKALPVLRASLQPGPEVGALEGRRVVAFAGIGRPQKFFDSLRGLGADVVASHPFADHYPYAPSDIQPILNEARVLDAIAVTTSKDAVRLVPEQRCQVNVLTVRVLWWEEDDIGALLAPFRSSSLSEVSP